MKETIAKLKDVTFTYTGGVVALTNVGFELNKGEVMAVMGENGAGKTTLCYLLSGIIPNVFGGTRNGRVEVCGFDPWDQMVYETSQKVSIVLQDPESQLLMPTIEMELAFGPANLGVPKNEILERINSALEIVGLIGLRGRSPKELSGGQKQRVALAAALTMMPRLLVLDEPTSQLDPLGSVEVIQALKRLKRKREMAMLITTHKTEETLELADKILVLHEGKAAAYGNPKEVLSRVDFLEGVGVRPPPITKFFAKMVVALGRGAMSNLPMSTNVAYKTLSKWHKEGYVNLEAKEAQKETKDENKQPPILEAIDLTYTYPGELPTTALRNINLKICEGEFVGIIGHNGSGKTTLVKSFVGLLKPARGEVLFRGKPLKGFKVGEVTKHIGLVQQNPDYQLFTISCREEVAFGLKNLGLAQEEVEKRTLEALRTVDLEEKIDAFPFSLSFGDRRKLAVAAVLAMEPEVLILDEATTAQDYRGRYMLADLIKEIHKKRKCTAIMVTHDMDLIASYAERMIVMWNGQILLDGPTRTVFEREDALKKAGLKPPSITLLSQKLRRFGVKTCALTVDELFSTINPIGGGLVDSL